MNVILMQWHSKLARYLRERTYSRSQAHGSSKQQIAKVIDCAEQECLGITRNLFAIVLYFCKLIYIYYVF